MSGNSDGKAVRKKLSRNTKIVAITAVVLTLAVASLAFMSRGYIAERKALQDSGGFLITAGGESIAVTMRVIENIDLRLIDANYKTNLLAAVRKQYTGVPLVSLFDYLGVDYSAARSVVFSASDGYGSAAPIADALDAGNCFIVFEEAGKPLGTRETGGTGPFMLIFANDRFSQRWCKYLLEITIS